MEENKAGNSPNSQQDCIMMTIGLFLNSEPLTWF
jgi:hypothetical protein